jgi:hypothetical protein
VKTVEDSWLTIQRSLKHTKVVLEEVYNAMLNSNPAKKEVNEARLAIKKLIRDEGQNIQAASSQVEYQELIKKLTAENLSFTEEDWDRAMK